MSTEQKTFRNSIRERFMATSNVVVLSHVSAVGFEHCVSTGNLQVEETKCPSSSSLAQSLDILQVKIPGF